MARANKYSKSMEAMRAADWVLAEADRRRRDGRKASLRPLDREASRIFDVGDRYIQDARNLIGSGNEAMIWEVREGKEDISVAIDKIRAAKSGNPVYAKDRGIYVLIENDDETAGKIGHGVFQTRFSHAQSGNKRPLRLIKAFRCRRLDERRIEQAILQAFPASRGGGEWLENLDLTAVHKIAVDNGAEWVPLVHGFDHYGRKINSA